MGRAIVREPALFLFDEPLSNLDARLRVQMRAEIRRLQRRLGVTSLFVTHDQTEAMTLGDRLVVMHAGHAAQVATPMEIWARPANTFVAGFIGSPSMNLLEAQLAEEGRAALLRAGPSLRFADGARPGPAGRRLLVGVRPEHLRPVAEGEGGAPLDVSLELAEPLGSESVLHGRLASGEAVTARVPGLVAGVEGALRLSIQASEAHVFDAETGARLDPIG
jgi:sn-glycerol 3-phosphate transport system ATP-binding protein